LVVRDVDLLSDLAGHKAAAVHVSLTTLDADLARRLEPRTSPPAQRLAAITALADAGVPAGVLVAPVIPGLNDHEIPALLAAAASAGARHAGYALLRLPGAVAPLFEAWLDHHEPGRKIKILNRLREMRGGTLNDPRFGSRMRGRGPLAVLVDDLFEGACRRLGLNAAPLVLSTSAFRRPTPRKKQLSLFE
jgi:DNA repair photolyase